jgi:hypothetical protein
LPANQGRPNIILDNLILISPRLTAGAASVPTFTFTLRRHKPPGSIRARLVLDSRQPFPCRRLFNLGDRLRAHIDAFITAYSEQAAWTKTEVPRFRPGATPATDTPSSHRIRSTTTSVPMNRLDIIRREPSLANASPRSLRHRRPEKGPDASRPVASVISFAVALRSNSSFKHDRRKPAKRSDRVPYLMRRRRHELARSRPSAPQ